MNYARVFSLANVNLVWVIFVAATATSCHSSHDARRVHILVLPMVKLLAQEKA